MQEMFLDNQAYWIKECRSTDLTPDQLKEMQEETGLPSKIATKDKGKIVILLIILIQKHIIKFLS
jgi:hypothetical protein